MTFLQSVLLGAVQGLTEFLPISSSGHLVILQNLLGVETEGGLALRVLFHVGTLLAIFAVFRRDILRLIGESVRMSADVVYNVRILIHNRKAKDARRYKKLLHNNYRKLAAMILMSSVPTAVIGYAAGDLVELASRSLLVPGICLILTAGLLLIADVTESGKRLPRDVSLTTAFLIGIAQGVSVLPGLSRAGTTITVCLLCGFDRRFAVKYSFLMSIPAILGAMFLELGGLTGGIGSPQEALCDLAGTAAAGVVGYFCIRRMLAIVKKKRFKGLALYCLAVGALSIGGYLAS